MNLIILSPIVICILASCTSNQHNPYYHWNGYKPLIKTYIFYPKKLNHLEKSFRRIIEKAQKKNKVPPGMYADYGYVLLTLGETTNAIIYFQKEITQWPDSESLMKKIIAYARRNNK